MRTYEEYPGNKNHYEIQYAIFTNDGFLSAPFVISAKGQEVLREIAQRIEQHAGISLNEKSEALPFEHALLMAVTQTLVNRGEEIDFKRTVLFGSLQGESEAEILARKQIKILCHLFQDSTHMYIFFRLFFIENDEEKSIGVQGWKDAIHNLK